MNHPGQLELRHHCCRVIFVTFPLLSVSDDLDLQGSVQSVAGGDGPAVSSRKGGHSHG